MEIAPALAAEGWSLLTDTKEMGVIFKSNGFPDRLVVTFDALSAWNHARAPISGAKAILDSRSDHMHIAYTGTSWYQSDDTKYVIPIAREICLKYRECVLTGHSMGGYAALLFSKSLGATKTVSFAPQFSIDPKKAPFEQRFLAYSKDCSFPYDDMSASISQTANHLIVYDPFDHNDGKHFALIRSCAMVHAIKIPFCGHNPGLVLKEAGLIRVITAELIVKSTLTRERRLDIRQGRRRSPRYFLNRAVALSQRGQLRAALDSANAAYILAPQSISVIETYFAVLQCDGIWIGLTHALLRLIVHEQPQWTHYQSLQNVVMENLIAQVQQKIKLPSARLNKESGS